VKNRAQIGRTASNTVIHTFLAARLSDVREVIT
jgi:hypothetical protein